MSARLTITRYQLVGELPKTFKDFEKGVRAHIAVPISPEGTEERAIGWCQHGDELNLQPSYRYADFIVLDMRIQTLKVPTKELNREVRIRREEIEKEDGAPMNKSRQIELKDLKRLELRKRLPSKFSSVPMLWDLDRRRIYVMTQTSSALESFLALFAATFNLAVDIEGSAAWGGTKLPLEARCQEFLTWFFYKIANETPWGIDGQPVTIILGDKMRLGLGEAQVIVDSDTDQARRALAQNYTVRELPLHIQIGDQMWTLTLDTSLQVRGVKLPALLMEELEEETLERAALLAKMDEILKRAYERYIAERLSDDWASILAAMGAWARA